VVVSNFSYWVELRRRLLYALFAVMSVFLALCYFSNDLYYYLAIPLLKHLNVGSGLIATGIVSPFLVPLKLTLVVAIFITIPFLLYQLWAFIAPALYQQERRLVWPLLFSSSLLFYLGVLFAYFVVFPLVFGFFVNTAPKGVDVKPDISQYLDFSLRLFFAFGAAFEVPVAIILLVKTGFTSVANLRRKRPYIIVAAFVIGMLLTPPDVVSQVLLALPIWLLFELGLVCARFFVKVSPI